MIKHKRRASQELTSNSVLILQPIPAIAAMKPTPGVLCRFWSWCTIVWLSVTNYSTMTYGSSEIVADAHIQSAESNNDGTTSLKRQKTRRQKHRSRSTVDTHRRGGRGKIDYTGCITEDDKRKRYNEYWQPREFGLLRKIAVFESSGIANSSSEEEHGIHKPLYRRYSEPSEVSRAPMPIQSAESRSSLESGMPITKPPRKPDSSPREKFQTSRRMGEMSLAERMDSLLLTPEGEQKEDPKLFPSGYMTEKRKLQARERRRKEKEAAIRVAKDLRLSRRIPRRPLIQSLSPKWEAIVNDAQWEDDPHRIITTSIGGTELRPKDFRTLLGRHAWLNDEIINSYIEWVVDAANNTAVSGAEARGEPASKVPKFIAHNSFFIENLIKKGPSSAQGLMRRKKAPGPSLMEVDSVFVPICKGSHWTVGVVRPVAKTIEYFDSLGGDPQIFVSLMRNWLNFQLGDSYVEEEWKVPRTAHARQTNGYDCGVFVCTNAFCVALGLDTSIYEERDMAMQRRNIAAVLINRGFIGEFAWGQGGL